MFAQIPACTDGHYLCNSDGATTLQKVCIGNVCRQCTRRIGCYCRIHIRRHLIALSHSRTTGASFLADFVIKEAKRI